MRFLRWVTSYRFLDRRCVATVKQLRSTQHAEEIICWDSLTIAQLNCAELQAQRTPCSCEIEEDGGSKLQVVGTGQNESSVYGCSNVLSSVASCIQYLVDSSNLKWDVKIRAALPIVS